MVFPSQEFFIVRYSKFDDAVNIVRTMGTMGKGCFMAKIDVKHAFRICPVNPLDWGLLGFCWRNLFFFDTRLPFGAVLPCSFLMPLLVWYIGF